MRRWRKDAIEYESTTEALETAAFFAGFHGNHFIEALLGVLSDEQREGLLERLGFVRHPAAETAGEESER